MFTTVSTAKRENKPGPHNVQCYKEKSENAIKEVSKGRVLHGDSISD